MRSEPARRPPGRTRAGPWAALAALLIVAGLRLDAGAAPSGAEEALARADSILAARGGDARRLWGAAGDESLARARGALAAASAVLTRLGETPARDLAGAGRVARTALAAQARMLGEHPRMPAVRPGRAPSAAAVALAARHGAVPTEQGRRALASLDRLPPGSRTALAAVIDAFIGFEEASAGLYGGSEPEAGAMGAFLGARIALLDRAVALGAALERQPPAASTAAVIPGIVSIDLTDTDNTYTADVRLLIDAGGDDVYRNNAGGSATPIRLGAPCGEGGTGALLDFRGADRYESGRDCGINGGGYFGTGFLLDGAGPDTYTAGRLGVNGGGVQGAGFLLDAGGERDVYEGGPCGANGGAHGEHTNQEPCPVSSLSPIKRHGRAMGFLLDAGGNDSYTARGGPANVPGDPPLSLGGNGGGWEGAGFLVDAGGDDAYLAESWAVNGGGANSDGAPGTGFLLDAAGTDTYTAGSRGTNGGGRGFFVPGSVGTLVDAGGPDTYTAGSDGANGGGTFGTGVLVDLGGWDAYTAGGRGANGGARFGMGLLVDLAGNDSYEAGACGANGSADRGIGLLLDGGGGDSYQDLDGGGGTDRTVVPKGVAGSQVDAPVTGPPAAGSPSGCP